MSGINIINIYALLIFKNIEDSGAQMPLSPKTMTYFIGASGFIGAYLGNFTVKLFSRRGLLINSHLVMAIFLSLVGFNVQQSSALWSLVFMCSFIVLFQTSNGSVFFVYCAECLVDSVLGFCVFILMTLLFLQSVTSLSIINSIGLDKMFYGLGAF